MTRDMGLLANAMMRVSKDRHAGAVKPFCAGRDLRQFLSGHLCGEAMVFSILKEFRA